MAHELSDGETEVSVLLPDRKYNGLWHRILHDRTADSIQAEVSKLPHANVTTVPFHFDAWLSDDVVDHGAAGRPGPAHHRAPSRGTTARPATTPTRHAHRRGALA